MPHISRVNSRFVYHVVAVFASAVHAAVYRAYAIRPYKWRKPSTDNFS